MLHAHHGGLGDAATDAYAARLLAELAARSRAWAPCPAPACGGTADHRAAGEIVTVGYAPIGVVELPLGFYLPLTEFQSMGPKTRTVSEAELAPGVLASIERLWHDASVERWNYVRQYGKGPGLEPQPAAIPYLSLNAFVQRYPEFVVGDYKGYAPPAPTTAEMTQSEGVRKYANRGGWLIWKPILDGTQPVTKTIPAVCLEGCRACRNSTWPGGVPQCKTRLVLETNNFTWGMFLRRDDNGRITMTLSRLPKSTWDKIEDGVDWLVGQIRSLLQKACQYSAGVTTAAGTAGGPGGAAAAALALSRYCGAPAAPSPSAPAPPRPSSGATTSALKPWYARGSTYAVAGGAVAAIGIAAFLARR